MTRVTLVVPCYNEAARLDLSAVHAFLQDAPDVELLLVDDGSTDDTARVLQRLAETSARCIVHSLPANRGKAEAVRSGMLAAIERGAVYAGYWDADLATPLAAVHDFVRVLDAQPGLELAMGSRVQLLGRLIQRGHARHYTGRVFATAASLLLGLRVYDTQCGAKLFRVNAATTPLFAQPFITRWLFDVELLARMIAGRSGNRAAVAAAIYELPLQQWRDVGGSKVRWFDGIRALADLARIRARYLAGTPRG